MPTERKRRKEALRRKKAKQRARESTSRVKYRRDYPSFEFQNPEIADPGFVEMVQRGLKMVDFDNRSQFSKDEADLWKAMKMFGGARVFRLMVKRCDGDEKHPAIYEFLRKIPTIICNNMPREQVEKYTPFNDFMIFPDKKITIRFRALRQKGGSHGTIYYSKNCPKIKINGEMKIIGFSRHAIEQTCSRLTSSDSAAEQGELYHWSHDIFSFFEQCSHFEPVVLPNGDLAFTFFTECTEGDSDWSFVEEVWAADVEKDYHYYYRLGYCPASVEGDFFVAKTILVPGYRNTPERQLIHNHRFPTRQEKYDMLEKAEAVSRITMKDTNDFTLFHFFHLHGVPQVRATEEVYYKRAFVCKPPNPNTQRVRRMVLKLLSEKK